ncbi:hypothetical protein ACSBR1_037351 [Camellia fascicularis]
MSFFPFPLSQPRPSPALITAESAEEQLEPLFDYHRVQTLDVVYLDDDGSDSSPAFSPNEGSFRVPL